MKEEWKIYTSHAGRKNNHIIEVSNEGNVKDNGRLIDFSLRHPTKYHQVHLFYVHRMVAELFIPNPENKPFIDHINTDKLDNRAENLRWVTQKENMNNPFTLKKCKEAWTEEKRNEQSEKIKKFADEHPEWKEDASKKMKEYYTDPENRKKTSKKLKDYYADPENRKKLGANLKGRKLMINLNEFSKPVFVKPKEFNNYINNGYVFVNPKNINY